MENLDPCPLISGNEVFQAFTKKNLKHLKTNFVQKTSKKEH